VIISLRLASRRWRPWGPWVFGAKWDHQNCRSRRVISFCMMLMTNG